MQVKMKKQSGEFRLQIQTRSQYYKINFVFKLTKSILYFLIVYCSNVDHKNIVLLSKMNLSIIKAFRTNVVFLRLNIFYRIGYMKSWLKVKSTKLSIRLNFNQINMRCHFCLWINFFSKLYIRLKSTWDRT